MTIKEHIIKYILEPLSKIKGNKGLKIYDITTLSLEDFLQRNQAAVPAAFIMRDGWLPAEEVEEGVVIVKERLYSIFLNLRKNDDNELIFDQLEDLIEANSSINLGNDVEAEIFLQGGEYLYLSKGLDTYEVKLSVMVG